MKKLNILFVIPVKSWGGQEIQTIELAKRLKLRGHSVVVATRRKSKVKENAMAAGLTAKNLRVRGSLDPAAILKICKLIIRWNIDIVHCHMIRAFWPSIVAAKICGCRVVVSKHLLNPVSPMTAFMLKKFPDRVIAVCEAARRSIGKEGFFGERVSVIYNGIDISEFRPEMDGSRVREKLGIPQDSTVIGCIGRLTAKGAVEIMKSAAQLKVKFPQARWLFVGAMDENPLVTMAREMGIEKEAIFTHQVQDVKPYLGAIDILATAPLNEAMSLVILEAMAAGKAVVATRVGGTPEAVRDGESGFLVPWGDLQKLKDALERLLGDRQRIKMFGRAGRRIVEEKFDINSTVDKIERVYEEILPEKA